MTAEQRRTTIARWNMAGYSWHGWSVRETTGVLYEELVVGLYESGQIDALRTFLRAAKDKSREAALDREIMGQSRSITPEPTPQLRGRPSA